MNIIKEQIADIHKIDLTINLMLYKILSVTDGLHGRCRFLVTFDEKMPLWNGE